MNDNKITIITNQEIKTLSYSESEWKRG